MRLGMLLSLVAWQALFIDAIPVPQYLGSYIRIGGVSIGPQRKIPGYFFNEATAKCLSAPVGATQLTATSCKLNAITLSQMFIVTSHGAWQRFTSPNWFVSLSKDAAQVELSKDEFSWVHHVDGTIQPAGTKDQWCLMVMANSNTVRVAACKAGPLQKFNYQTIV